MTMTPTDAEATPDSHAGPDDCAATVSDRSKAGTQTIRDESSQTMLAAESLASDSNSPNTPNSIRKIAVPPDNDHDSIPPVAAVPSLPDRRRKDGIKPSNIQTSGPALLPSLPTQKSTTDSLTQTDIQLGTEGSTTILLTQPDEPSSYPLNIRRQDFLSDDRDVDPVVKEPFLDINANNRNIVQPVNILEQQKHMRLEDFFKEVQQALQHSRPRHAKYPAVHVLLIYWTDHGVTGLKKEVDAVEEVFHKHYNFTTDRWALPTVDPDLSLDDGLVKFRKKYPDENDLYIIYYNGHGFVENDECHWASRSDDTTEGASFAWNPVQKKLERDKHEILFILDCCYAGAAAQVKGRRTAKELLAAVDHRTETPAGRESFSNRLVEAFEYCKYRPVTVGWLDQYLRKTRKIDRREKWSLELDTRHLCLQPGKQPIVISPIQKNSNQRINQEELLFETLPDNDDVTDDTSTTAPNGALASELPSNVNGTPPTSLSGPLDLPPLPDKRRYFAIFKVLIEENVILDEENPHISDWETWFGTQAPPGFATLEEISIDASYQSGSALLIVSVPLSVWDFLPPNPAYMFLGLTHSQNLVRHALPSGPPKVSATDQTISKTTTTEEPSPNVDAPAEWITDLSKVYEKWKHGKVSTFLDEAAGLLRLPRIGKDPAFVLLREACESTTYRYEKIKPTSSTDHATISRRIDDVIHRLEKLKLQPSDTDANAGRDPLVQSVSVELNILKTQISELGKEDLKKLLRHDIVDAIKLEREKEHPGDGQKLGRMDSSLWKGLPRRMSPKATRGGNVKTAGATTL